MVELFKEIEDHHVREPTHGVSCACMDTLIQRFRKLTKASTDVKFLQRRIDYVIRAAIDNRPPGDIE